MNVSKKSVAQEIIGYHFKTEEFITEIWRFDDDNDCEESIKLLEVNEATISLWPPWPMHFSPTIEIPFFTVIIETTPHEFSKVQKDFSLLPIDWHADKIQKFKRPV